MQKTTNLKTRLIASLLVLVMLISSLLGTTFAWFTDSVTSGGNKIISGSLKVDLELLDKETGVWSSIKESKKAIFDYKNWEPGYVDAKVLKVENEGSLALKWKAMFVSEDELSELANVIDVYVRPSATEIGYPADRNLDGYEKVGTVAQFVNTIEETTVGELLAGQCAYLGIALKMQETAGNEYQKKTIGEFDICIVATQLSHEEDSFGKDYDDKAEWPSIKDYDVVVDVAVENGAVKEETVKENVIVPAGVKVDKSTLGVTVKEKESSDANLTLSENETMKPLDVHVDGIAADNTVALIIALGEVMPKGLNIGNYTLYHVENEQNVAMTAVSSVDELDAHNEFYYDPATGEVTVAMATFSEVALVADNEAKWEGEFNYTWYDATKTEFVIANADQLAAFGAIVGGMKKVTERVDGKYTYSEEVIQDSFAGKTVKLVADINIGDTDSENGIVFYPIGYYNSEGTYERTNTAITSGFYTFEGTFDGNGNTISNFYQNTWEMKGDHDWYSPEEQYYRDGMGLFGKVYGGTVKNLTVKNFSSDGEITTTGTIAAYAEGATFENIAIFDCNPRVYNIGNGGIVGCVGWYAKEANLKTTFTNITVDNSNKISALWGSYDVACGGIVGQYYPTSGQSSYDYPVNAGVHFENCHVSAVMDVYNDVCANYQYYAYRYTGMLIGSVRENETIDGHVYPKMDGITASGCTVHFGDWNDYYYCELVANTTASYTHDHQMSRLEQVASVDVENMKIVTLKGEEQDIPTSGRVNYVVVKDKDDNGMWIHGDGHDYAECYHFVDGEVWNHEDAGYHNGENGEKFIDENGDGEADLKEDKQLIYREFNQLFTGYGWGVTSKGLTDYEGVENMDIKHTDNEESVKKFEGKVTELSNGIAIKLGDIFDLITNSGVDLIPAAVAVGVTNLDENNPVSATFKRDTENWENGTITFTGTGKVNITIQDYYFCTPTTIEVTITERQKEEKFDLVFPNIGKYLYRVGNQNAVKLGSLFKAKDGVTVGTVSVTIEALNDTVAFGTYTSNATWTNGTIQFSGTGVVKVTITDNDYCIPTELTLEVVDAKNVTAAESATANNVVLLNDVSGSFTVYNGNTVYGNGFTVTLPTAYQANYTAGYVGYITMNNGNLDNVRIEGPVYPVMNIYQSQSQNDTTNKEEYFYNSILINGGNCTISNSYISGSRTAICVRGGNNVVIDNTTLSGGAVANMELAGINTIILRDLTTVQTDEVDSYGQNKTSHGMGIYVSTGIGTIYVEGELVQRNWVNETQWNNLVGSYATFFPKFFTDGAYADYQKKIDNVTYVNLAMVFACNWNAENLDTTQQTNSGEYAVKDGIQLQGYIGGVYSVTGVQPTADDLKEIEYQPSGFSPIAPKFDFDNSANHDENDENDVADTYCEYSNDTGILSIGITGSTKTIDLSGISIKRNGIVLPYTTYLNGNQISGNSVTIKSADGTKQTLVFKVVSTEAGYDATGNPVVGEITYLYTITLEVATLAYPAPVWNVDGYASGTTTYQVGTTNCYYVYYKTSQGYGEAVPIYDGIKINYYDKTGSPVSVDLSSTQYEPKGTGETIALNTAFTYTLDDGSILSMKITGSYKSGVAALYFTNYNNKTYVYPAALDNDSSVRPSKTGYDFNVSIKYTFTDPNGLSTEEITMNWYGAKANGSSISDEQWQTFDADNGKKPSSIPCVTPDTLVTLADGTQKEIQYVTYADQLLVWNFYTGEYTVAPASILMNHGYANVNVVTLTFADGTTVNTINGHGFFDVATNEFVLLDESNAADYIGHEFVKQDGDGYTTTTLVGYSVEERYTEVWSVLTAEHYNCVLNGMWTVTAAEVENSPEWLMPYEIGEDMKYDEAKMQADIEKYGLYTYEDFADYMTYEQFVALGIANFKVSVGKGYITWDEILYLIGIHIA